MDPKGKYSVGARKLTDRMRRDGITAATATSPIPKP
jgi:hypothetical protein